MQNQYLQLEEAMEVESEDDEVRMRHRGDAGRSPLYDEKMTQIIKEKDKRLTG